MKRLNILSLMLLLLASCGSGRSLVVTNDSFVDRVNEIIEVDIDHADDYVVYTAEGDILQCQTTYDGKLIFPATVDAKSTADYILKKGRRLKVDTLATGKVYPAWFDDFGWENDKIAFRTYSEKMGAKGDKLYGYDIFTKRHKWPVLDILYGANFDPEYSKFKKNNPSVGQALSYHVDHGIGMDYYVVGPTLGSGTAALVSDGEILYPKFYDKVELLDGGGLRLTFRLTYDAVEINGEWVQEVRTITLDSGTHFNHIEVEYKNLTKPTDLVVGIVLHDDGKSSLMGDGYVAYAEPKHKFGWQTYNAVIYPEGGENRVQYFEAPIGTAKGHLLVEGRYTPGEKLSYYMGAGWNRWGFKTPEDWFNYVKAQSEAREIPLTYKLR